MSAWPTLRADLVPIRSGGELTALDDPLAGRRVTLDAEERAVVARLAAGGLAAVVAGGPEAERALRSLLLLNLVEGAGSSIRERLRRAREEKEPAAVFVPGSRFGCQANGDCCSSYEFGPLKETDRARLAAVDLARAFPWLEGRFLVSRPGPEGPRWFLATRPDGRCVFLRPDLRCGIHAEFGAEAKPDMCRLYPWRAQRTIDGLKVFDRGECANFATSARAEPTLASDLPRVRSLLAPLPLHHPVVHLDAGLRADFGWVLALQAAACERVARAPSAALGLAAAVRLAEELGRALAACPLRPGEPDATVAAVLAGDAGVTPAAGGRGEGRAPGTAPEAREGFRALVAVGEALADALAPIAFGPASSPDHLELAAVLELLVALASSAVDRDRELAPAKRAIARVALPGELDAVLRVSLENALFGERILLEERLAAGLLRLGVVHLVALLAAKRRAHEGASREVRAADLSAGHRLAVRLLAKPFASSVFLAHERQAWAVGSVVGSIAAPA